MKVYDLLGREVATLVNEETEAGYHSIDFSTGGGFAYGINACELPSGAYFYQLRASPSSSSPKWQAGKVFIDTKRMLLLK